MIKEFVKLAYKLLHSSDHYNYSVNDAGQIDSSFYTKRITKIISSGFTTSVKEEIKQKNKQKRIKKFEEEYKKEHGGSLEGFIYNEKRGRRLNLNKV